MKKFILGLLVGVSITAAGSAYADDITQSIIGKKIDGEFPIKIDGKQLDTKAAVLEGTSYLPVRAIGEALNMDVKFDADLGIELKPKGATTVTETAQPTPSAANPTDESLVDPSLTTAQKIEYLKNEIDSDKWIVISLKASLNPQGGGSLNESAKKKTQDSIVSYESKIAAMQALLAQLQQQ